MTFGHDGRITVLDGWRGFAIFIVVVHNGGAAMPVDGSLVSTLTRSVLATGWVGVSLFFVLSGFLITGILLDTRRSPGFLRNFYVRRTLRIFPLYYATLVVAFVLVPLLVAPGEWTRTATREQVWFWTYLQNWTTWHTDLTGLGHFWSLAVEEQFYVVWPLLVLLFGTRAFPYVTATVVVGAFLARLVMHWGGLPNEALYQTTIARADALGVGALLAISWRREQWWTVVRAYRVRLLVWVSVPLAFLIVANEGLEPKDTEVLLYGQTLVAILFGLALVITMDPAAGWERRLARWLNWSALRGLGKYSYAIYLVHLPVHFLLLPQVAPSLQGLSAADRAVRIAIYGMVLLTISTALAVLAWHLLERRFLDLKDRWAPRPP